MGSPRYSRLDRALARLRQTARPSVHALRRARARVRNRLWPSRAWDGAHHPVLRRFPRWSGESDGRFHHDFLGIRTDPRFKGYFAPDPAGPVAPDYPAPGPSYFELVFVLDSVVRSCESHARPFTMLELGAGYGPWLVTAHRAVQAISPRSVQLVGVEMNPRHVGYLHDHLLANGIDPATCEIHHAAISDVDGSAMFLAEPDPNLAYGQRIRRRFGGRSTAPDAPDETDVQQVPCLRLETLLDAHGVVDLIHMDVQGEELRILQSALPRVGQSVSNLLVTTHSAAIHRRLRELLVGDGWRLDWDLRCRAREATAFGHVQLHDGLLAAVNPALDSPAVASLRP